MKKINLSDFTYTGKEKFAKAKTKVKDYYKDEEDYELALRERQDRLDELQTKLYANSKYGVLVLFQAMDAAGKDGTLRAVFKNVNPLGLRFISFKRPSTLELNHDYLWRCIKELPERGTVQVFNRSYYEEVLVVKVHPDILKNQQRIPEELIDEDIWKDRYEDIRNFEKYLSRNGIKLIKFFLNVSKEEQGERLIERIEDPTKNWKFEEGDVKEREYWDHYMDAYKDMINETSTKRNPWHVIPADDKKNMRLIVADILIKNFEELQLDFPKTDPERKASLDSMISIIKK
jgi:PPK2 family polyphosphate:nucleotide phosphotransferase